MSEEIANQSEQSPIEIERDAATEAAFESFGLAPRSEKKDVEFPNMDEPTDSLTMEDEEDDFREETTAPEKKFIKTKFNGEDKDFDPDDEQVPVLLQKGMNYDKVQQKLTEQQKALDEVARMQGFKDHAELISELPRLREQQQQKEQNAYKDMIQDIRQQAEDAGLDPDQVEAYLNNSPVVKEAQKAIQERESERAERETEYRQRVYRDQWQELYSAFPDIIEDSQSFDKGESPKFFTAEMKSLVEQGYKPLHAYKLAHMDKIQTQTKKSTEQRLIKEQQLGVRSAAAGQAPSLDSEVTVLPAQMALAEEFGVSVKGIQRQNQLIKNRR